MSTCRATGSAGNPPFCKRPNRDSKARADSRRVLKRPDEKWSLEADHRRGPPVPANPAQSGACDSQLRAHADAFPVYAIKILAMRRPRVEENSYRIGRLLRWRRGARICHTLVRAAYE
ncbi:hypothetical protein MTO96_010380 [Rhipicephalus appendiculatus]